MKTHGNLGSLFGRILFPIFHDISRYFTAIFYQFSTTHSTSSFYRLFQGKNPYLTGVDAVLPRFYQMD